MTLSERKSKISRVCGKNYLAVKSSQDSDTSVAMIKLRCNSWLCPVCRSKKSRKFSVASQQLFDGKKVSILTLTMDRKHGLYSSWLRINPAWNRLRTAIVKRFGKVTFVRVIEPQPKSGYPHFHILIDKYIPSSWLAHRLESVGFGRIFDIQKIDGKGAFHYVKKYLKKAWSHSQASEIAFNIGIRRISGSRGFSLSKSSKLSWQVLGLVSGVRPYQSFGIYFSLAFPTGAFSLVGTEISESWLCLKVRDIMDRSGPLFSAFALDFRDFAPFSW